MAAAAAALASSLPASAATWDGGSGTWSTSVASWDGGNLWVQGSPAVFAGTAGTVSLGEAITASAVSLNSNSYVIDLSGSNLSVSGITGGSSALNTGTITNGSLTPATYSTGGFSGGSGPKLSGNMNVTYTGAAWTPSIDHDFSGTLSFLGSGLIRTDGTEIGINSSASLLRLGGTHTLQLGAANGKSRTYARSIELLTTTAGFQTNGVQLLSLTGNISGTGNFVRSGGQGMIVLAGNNTFTGKVTSLGGNAVIVAASPTAFGAANVDSLLNLVEGGSNSNTVGFLGGVDVNGAKNITMGGSIRPDGLGTYHNFGGTNSFAGNVTMSNQQMFVVESGSQLTLKGILGGGRSLLKQGDGTLVLANAMTFASTSNGEFRRLTRVVEGKLLLDFSQPASPLVNIVNSVDQSGTSSAASLAGGTLEIKGKAGIVGSPVNNSQFFQAWRVDLGASSFNIVAAENNNVSVRLNGLTTRVVAGTVDFGLPAGTQVSGTHGFNTTKLNVNGIIGGYATANRTSWATSGTAGTNAITEYVHTALEQGATAFDTATNNVDVNASNSAPASDRTINSLRFAAGGTLALSGTNNLLTSGGILATGNAATVITGGTLKGAASADLVIHQFSSAPISIASTISDNTAATALTKTGTGTLVLSGTNDYTGTTYIHGGVLKLDSAGALPASSHLSLRGGVVGLTADFTRAVGATGATVDWLGSGGFAAYGGDRVVNLGGVGATVTWNTGTWEANVITTEGMYLGGAFVGTNYKLMLGSSDATGTVILQNNVNLAGSNNAPLTRGIEVANSATIDVEARISGVLSGSASAGLTKTGAGTLELTGTNTYSGSTIVRQGDLRVTGSLSTNSLVNVLEAGILSGAGLLGPITLETGGTLAPGAGVGILNTRDLTLSGGTFAVQLQSVATFDQLNVTGTVSLTSAVNLTLSLATTFAEGVPFMVIANNGTDAITLASPLARFVYNGNSLDEGETFTASGGFGTQNFQISYAGGIDNNDVVLTAVPEPGAVAMMLGGFACLFGFQRRRSFPRNR